MQICFLFATFVAARKGVLQNFSEISRFDNFWPLFITFEKENLLNFLQGTANKFRGVSRLRLTD